jgi:hypothetical protein
MVKTKSWSRVLVLSVLYLGLYIAAMMIGSYAMAIGVIVFSVFTLGVYLLAKTDWGNYPTRHKMGR